MKLYKYDILYTNFLYHNLQIIEYKGKAVPMKNYELESILLLIALIFILKSFLTAISNSYIKKNKERLFNDNYTLAQRCKDLGSQLLEQITIYYEYIKSLGLNQTYLCSSSVVSNASNNSVKYLIKYSSIENSMYCLEQLDFCTNYMQSLIKLNIDMNELYMQVKPLLPLFIRLFATSSKVPYLICGVSYEITKVKKPVFCFLYVSPAGKSRRSYKIEVTSDLMRSLQSEISAKINKSGHSTAQRRAMTNDLREAIKKRDNYTCCLCGNSVFNEPNLLLEVDHIIPISKGGKTEASNLQTLCWRCNRIKSDNL